MLAREYEDVQRFAVHRLTVDAYAVQHPGQCSRQATQSVALHLMSLHGVIERGWSCARATTFLGHAAAARREPWPRLAPPPTHFALTVLHALAATDAASHQQRVHAWAESAWRAWAAHHTTVRDWVQETLAG